MAARKKDSPDTPPHRLGAAIRRARRALGYRSQKAFGLAVGVSERMIWALENGEDAGDATVDAVGLFLEQRLRGWGADTPQLILAGGPVPKIELIDPEKVAKARLDIVWDKAKVDISAIARHKPEARNALRRLVVLRKKHGSAGLTDTRLLDAVEHALKDEEA